MTDIVSKAKRSQMMSGIKEKNTKPEKIIRSLLHGAGFRFRLHVKKMPGKPDLVFPKYHAVIFVHGCFWHAHDCSLFRLPGTNTLFWNDKIMGNKERDRKTESLLHELGWRIMTLWECSIRGKNRLEKPEVLRQCREWLVNGTGDATLRGL